MRWVLASSFVAGDRWITGLLDPARHQVVNVEPDYVHDRSRRGAGARDWLDYARHACHAWIVASKISKRTGIITTFPQLALLLALWKRVSRSRRPIVAMMFNLGRVYGGLKGRVARFGLAAVDRFVVHSTHEIEVYSQWLGLPRDRFIFMPLSVTETLPGLAQDTASPFILAMGSANRDYALLTRALVRSGHEAVVVAAPHALAGLHIPDRIRVLSGQSIDACHALCQRARISVVPLADTETAAGQVSVVEAMMLGAAVVTTAAVGTVDYIQSGVDGVLVEAGDEEALVRALELLWNDDALRQTIGAQGPVECFVASYVLCSRTASLQVARRGPG